MTKRRIMTAISLSCACFMPLIIRAQVKPARYSWLSEYDSLQSLAARIPPPENYTLQAPAAGSFAAWLSGLPLRPGKPPVLLYDGRQKANQEAHAAVIDIDVGRRNLQQCADAVIRLRAEYLFASGRADDIRFRFTSGHEASFAAWTRGERPRVKGSDVRWIRSAQSDSSRESFRRYLDVVFTYAGSYSLSRELCAVDRIEDLRAGDVFIQGGFPGHAVLVVAVAVHRVNGRKAFLLAQSYMPAQQIHVLRNPTDADLSPWYSTDFGEELVTPEWIFRRGDLKRFHE